jgi:hypothetical protein
MYRCIVGRICNTERTSNNVLGSDAAKVLLIALDQQRITMDFKKMEALYGGAASLWKWEKG